VKRYSSGMYARLGFAVAAHVDPDILIVDEVLSVGDYVFQRKCLERMTQVISGGATVVFVSHNLRAVTNVCARTMLLDHGCPLAVGPTADVVKTYIDRARQPRGELTDREVYIASVRLRGSNGEAVTFRPGDQAWVDVEVTARAQVERIAIGLYLKDQEDYDCFNTSTQRLGLAPVSLGPGQRLRCTFRTTLHLAHGTFHVGVTVYRYDIQRALDRWSPAATLLVSGERDVRGIANLYPEVERLEIVR
jgi:lipopolysaccharide transport system ATP-binding protein